MRVNLVRTVDAADSTIRAHVRGTADPMLPARCSREYYGRKMIAAIMRNNENGSRGGRYTVMTSVTRRALTPIDAADGCLPRRASTILNGPEVDQG
jgi:hypothetical protein